MARAWLVLALLTTVTGVSSISGNPESLKDLGPVTEACQLRSSHAEPLFTSTEILCQPGTGDGRITSLPVVCPNASRAAIQAAVVVQVGHLTFEVLDEEDRTVFRKTSESPAKGLTGALVGKGQPGHGWHLVAETSEDYTGAFAAELRCGLGL